MPTFPQVTFGLPVYNGSTFIKECLDSLLNQTYTDFEIIISDNASTDGTMEIIQGYAAKDARIRILQSDRNRGATWNYNRVLKESRGVFFKWAPHDDRIRATYLEECLDALNKNPDSVLTQSQVQEIDENGLELRIHPPMKDTLAKDGLNKLSQLIQLEYSCEWIMGLIRTPALLRSNKIGDYSDSDRVLILQLALMGGFVEVSKPLLFRRTHKGQSSAQYANRAERMVWFNPALKNKIAMPYFREFWEFIWVWLSHNGAWPTKVKGLPVFAAWLIKYRIELIGDLNLALRAFSRQTLYSVGLWKPKKNFP